MENQKSIERMRPFKNTFHLNLITYSCGNGAFGTKLFDDKIFGATLSFAAFFSSITLATVG